MRFNYPHIVKSIPFTKYHNVELLKIVSPCTKNPFPFTKREKKMYKNNTMIVEFLLVIDPLMAIAHSLSTSTKLWGRELHFKYL